MGYFKNRNCKVCGIEFEPTNPTQKFCIECGNINHKIKISQYNKKYRLKRRSEKELKSNKKEVIKNGARN